MMEEFRRKEAERLRQENRQAMRSRDLGSASFLPPGVGGGRIAPFGGFAPTPAPIMSTRLTGGNVSTGLLEGTSFATDGGGGGRQLGEISHSFGSEPINVAPTFVPDDRQHELLTQSFGRI